MQPTIKIQLFDNVSVELTENYYTEMKLDKITGPNKDITIKKLIAARYRVKPENVEIIH